MSDNISGQDSRQGKRGRPALYVLIVSVGLVLTSLAGLMIWQGATAPPDYASQSQAASRKQITGSESGKADTPSSANSTGVPGGNPAYPQPALRSVNP
ncbi:hypothetical protein MCBMB27_05393 [Methylobacterium phyllosphaerae]|uniref:Uncharacterized protein n=1 Tax=Methylobacterium phyllosphaerae TaxID=418223 RepID=A0AAE8HVC6_9HYPH|nr:hypothetical protein [Methylobacterium phyllosphaerae]APT34684.1 hypothetical protein MCBMB27_05393 [Methylobacterium phyllosphaerae]SFH37631.1 hypothetical protein SAMN05192567_12223 [Methylobacterium phyllosphaerae]